VQAYRGPFYFNLFKKNYPRALGSISYWSALPLEAGYTAVQAGSVGEQDTVGRARYGAAGLKL